MEVNPYERLWITITVAAIIVMLAAISLASFGLGFTLTGDAGTIDPRQLAQTPPFDKPGVYELAPGKYQAVLVAFAWGFNPKEIKVPAGAEVTFKVTSRDITHGMLIEGTNVNIMIVPGQITEATVTFPTPGTHLFVCHEYCGVGHQAMAGQVIVEAP